MKLFLVAEVDVFTMAVVSDAVGTTFFDEHVLIGDSVVDAVTVASILDVDDDSVVDVEVEAARVSDEVVGASVTVVKLVLLLLMLMLLLLMLMLLLLRVIIVILLLMW
jgi:hypothetical protein